MQLRFAIPHHKITRIRKVGHGFGLVEFPNIWGSPSIFTQWLKLAASNLINSLGLPRPIIRSQVKSGQGFALGELPKIFRFHFNIYTMAETRDFKFGIQLWFATEHYETAPTGKVGLRGLGLGSSHIFGVPVYYFCSGRAVLLALAELLVIELYTPQL